MIKKFSAVSILLSFTITACAPAVGSKEWCEDLKEKDKGDWTAEEAKDFAKHCIFRSDD